MRSIRIEGGPIVVRMRVVDAETGEPLQGVTGFRVWGDVHREQLCRAQVDFVGVECAITAQEQAVARVAPLRVRLAYWWADIWHGLGDWRSRVLRRCGDSLRRWWDRAVNS